MSILEAQFLIKTLVGIHDRSVFFLSFCTIVLFRFQKNSLRFVLQIPSMATSNQRSERKLPPPPQVAPWLLYPHGRSHKFQTFCNISQDLDTKRYFKKFIPELSIKKIWQKNSHQGWVVALCFDDEDPNFNYKEFFLWNPATLETILLPREPPDLPEDDYFVRDVVLSSPPQLSSDNNNVDFDSMVYILYHGGAKPDILIYCHPGEKQWRKHEFVDVCDDLESMFYFNGKLFIMCLRFASIEITIQQQNGSLNVSDRISIATNFGGEVVAGDLPAHFQSYYIESFGQVYRINRYSFPRGIYENCVTSMVVAKLDFSTMTWEGVKSMDDHVFFLSGNTQLSCLASDLGFSKGFVYYTLAEELSLYRYDLEDDSILLSLPCPNLPAPWYPPQWLMIPATPRFVDSTGTTDVLGKDTPVHKVIRATENGTADKDSEKEDVKEAAGLRTVLNDDHMVWLISNYLHTLDYVHLRGASKNHQRLLDLRRSSSTRAMQTTDVSPWLVFPKYDPAVYSFINPMHNNENYLMNIPELLKGSRIRSSKGGWLLVSRGKTLFFYNPFTKSTVKLPELPDSHHHYDFTGITFSSLPTSSDCVVFAINKSFPDMSVISFIKRGDESWTHDVFANIYLPPRKKNVEFEINFNSPVFYRGAFYCLDQNGTLGVFQLENGSSSWEILAMVSPPNCEFIYKSFLVECDGKLMSVLLGHLGKWVRIFRFDETKMVWVEVRNLGRHMLCISNTSCISAVALASRMENKIFFPRLHNEGILYYSLDTGMYHSFGSKHSAKDYSDSKENLHCTWIEPNWSEISDYYLDWHNI